MAMYCRFFFFKQKTAYEMRISDWSSDVCSSDLVITEEDAGDPVDLEQCLRQRRPRGLLLGLELGGTTRHNLPARPAFERRRVRRLLRLNEHDNPPATSGIAAPRRRQTGRASGGGRGCQYG